MSDSVTQPVVIPLAEAARKYNSPEAHPDGKPSGHRQQQRSDGLHRVPFAPSQIGTSNTLATSGTSENIHPSRPQSKCTLRVQSRETAYWCNTPGVSITPGATGSRAASAACEGGMPLG